MKTKILLALSIPAILATSALAGFSGANTSGSHSTTNKDGKKNWRYDEGENTTTFKISSASPSPTPSPTPTATPSPSPRPATASPAPKGGGGGGGTPAPTAAPSKSWAAFSFKISSSATSKNRVYSSHGWKIQTYSSGRVHVTTPCGVRGDASYKRSKIGGIFVQHSASWEGHSLTDIIRVSRGSCR